MGQFNTTKRARYHNVVAVDPGVHTSAWAMFRVEHGGDGSLGRLIQVGKVHGKGSGPDLLNSLEGAWWSFWHRGDGGPYVHHPGGWTLVVEGQQAYGDATNKADRADVLDLTVSAAVCMVTAMRADVPPSEILFPLPATWKGQRSKDAHHAQALAVLTPAERAQWNTGDHNIRDAVALGLWALGRLF